LQIPGVIADVATRQAYGRALEKLGELDIEIVALDGDVKNSTGAEAFAKRFPDRFFESYIAEQNMVGVVAGARRLWQDSFCRNLRLLSQPCLRLYSHGAIQPAAASRAVW
jgi:transketolase C-terminal domain/subunit